MAAPDFVAAARAAGNAAFVTISKPSGVVEGDVLLAAIGFRGGTMAVSEAPTGWTLVLTVTDGAQHRLNVYRKKLGAAEDPNYSWILSSSTFVMGVIAAYRGAAEIPDTSSSAAGTSSSSVVASSVTTSVPNTRLVAFFSGNDNNSGSTKTMSTPPGMVERSDNNTASTNGLSVADEVQSSAGASGTRTATCSATLAGWAAVVVALVADTVPPPAIGGSRGFVGGVGGAVAN